MHQGTVKRYLSDVQMHMLAMLKRHILQSKSHPILILCEVFREEFYKVYNQYSKPEKTSNGVFDKVGVV